MLRPHARLGLRAGGPPGPNLPTRPLSQVRALLVADPQIQKRAQAAAAEEAADLRNAERRRETRYSRSLPLRQGRRQEGNGRGEGEDNGNNRNNGNNGGNGGNNDDNGGNNNGYQIRSTTVFVTNSKVVVTKAAPTMSAVTTISFTAGAWSINTLPSSTPAVHPTISSSTSLGTSSSRPSNLSHSTLSSGKPAVGVIVAAVLATIVLIILVPLGACLMRHIRKRFRAASSEFTTVPAPHPFTRIPSLARMADISPALIHVPSRSVSQMADVSLALAHTPSHSISHMADISPALTHMPSRSVSYMADLSPTPTWDNIIAESPTLIYATPLPAPSSPFNDGPHGSRPSLLAPGTFDDISAESDGLSHEHDRIV